MFPFSHDLRCQWAHVYQIDQAGCEYRHQWHERVCAILLCEEAS